MSRRNKLEKFADILSFPNVYENFQPREPKLLWKEGIELSRKGKWAEEHFKNNNPIVLELACGRGEYTLALAEKYPDKNFIGLDIKGARIWKGAKYALENKIDNAAFLRTKIEQIALFFAPGEVDEIWITFPDPFLRKSKAKRRLTSSRFLNEYKKIIKKDALIHLKTDELRLYEFTLETLAEFPGARIIYQDDDIYAKPFPYSDLEIKTYYEELHIAEGPQITYVRFSLGG